jgi:hypothetical protein
VTAASGVRAIALQTEPLIQLLLARTGGRILRLQGLTNVGSS